MSKETHILDFSVALDATPEEIWGALTEPERITRWFSPEAKVTPGLGGKIFLSWGPGMEGEAPITAWEPGRRFAWTEKAETDNPRVIEFTIAVADGGPALLRLTHSGFKTVEGEYESTSAGWQSYLQLLKLDLEENRGAAAQHLCRLRMAEGTPSAIGEKLRQALEWRRSGDRYAARLPDGTEFSGRIVFERAPGYSVQTLEPPLSGALALFAESCGGQTALTASWYLRGDAVNRAEAIGAAWDQIPE